MSIKKLAIRGVVFNWLGRGCSLVITFFLTPYLVLTLGDERYGIWSIVMSLTSYYALTDMGLRGAGTKYIAQFHAVDDHESINKVVVTSLVVYLGIAVSVLIISGIVSWIVPSFLPTNGITVTDLRCVILLTAGTVAIRMLAQVFNAALAALQRHDITNVFSVVQQIARAVAVVTVLHFGGGLVEMAIATLVVAALGQFARAWVSIRLLPGLSFSPRHVNRDTFLLVFKFGGASTIPRMARRITQNLAGVFIGFALGPAAVTMYDIPARIVNKLTGLGRSFNSVLLPLSSRLQAQSDYKGLHQLVSNSVRLLFTLSASACILLLCMGDSIIRLWIAPKYVASGYPILCILSIAFIPRVVGMPLRAVLRGTAQLRPLNYIALVEVSTTLIFAVVLVNTFGAIGMAWAILIAQFTCGGVLVPFATCRVLEFPIGQFARQVIPRTALAVLPAACIAVAFRFFPRPHNLGILLPQLAIIAFASLVAAFFVCLSASRRDDIYAALTSR